MFFNTKIVFILLLIICFSLVLMQGVPVSPCPRVFNYNYNGYEWRGIIHISNIQEGETLLQVKLVVDALLPTNYVGELNLYNKHQQINQPAIYIVRFPLQNPIPKVEEITINNVPICYGPRSYSRTKTDIYLHNRLKLDYFGYHIPLQNNQLTHIPTHTPSPFQSSYDLNPFLNYESDEDPTPIYETQTQPPIQYTKITRPPRRKLITNIDNYSPFFPTSPPPSPTSSPPSPSSTPSPPPFTPPSTPPPDKTIDSFELNTICGQVFIPKSKPLVYGGELVSSGSWPWLVAIFIRNGNRFLCSGTLISSRTVITSGHCYNYGARFYNANDILISLGRHSITNWSEPGSITTLVSRIYIHPDWKRSMKENSYDGDIALTILQQKIQFTQTILPACMWSNSIKMQLEGTYGVVAGWGKDESGGSISEVPKKVSTKIVSELVCLRSNPVFVYITSNRTFCAGQKNGQGPCAGDSGSGFMIRYNQKWWLRGVVSAGLTDDVNNCNLNEYSVYTDVDKFLDFINTYFIY